MKKGKKKNKGLPPTCLTKFYCFLLTIFMAVLTDIFLLSQKSHLVGHQQSAKLTKI